MNDQLKRAMDAVDLEAIDAIASSIGAEAVQTALAVRAPREEADRGEKQKAEAAEQRQRDADAALADAIETVARHRARLGRRTCTAQDGAAVRKVFELLRGLTPGMDE